MEIKIPHMYTIVTCYIYTRCILDMGSYRWIETSHSFQEDRLATNSFFFQLNTLVPSMFYSCFTGTPKWLSSRFDLAACSKFRLCRNGKANITKNVYSFVSLCTEFIQTHTKREVSGTLQDLLTEPPGKKGINTTWRFGKWPLFSSNKIFRFRVSVWGSSVNLQRLQFNSV